MFEVKNLHCTLNNTNILKGISFQVNNGEIVSLIGSSGSGKTTILRNLCGFIKPTTGEILINGEQISRTNRENLGLIPQGQALFEHMTVMGNVTYALIKVKRFPKQQAVKLAGNILSKLSLADKKNSYPSQLSGGQKQRVAIARSLVMEPKIILFDEPTAGLDTEITKNIVETILKISKSGISILMVTHDLLIAKKISNRILFLDGGLIIEDTPSNEFFVKPKTEQAKKFLSNMLIN